MIMTEPKKLTKEERKKQHWIHEQRINLFKQIVERIMKYRQLVDKDFGVHNASHDIIRFIRQFNDEGEHTHTLVVLYGCMGQALIQVEFDDYYLCGDFKYLSHDYNLIDSILDEYARKYKFPGYNI